MLIENDRRNVEVGPSICCVLDLIYWNRSNVEHVLLVFVYESCVGSMYHDDMMLGLVSVVYFMEMMVLDDFGIACESASCFVFSFFHF